MKLHRLLQKCSFFLIRLAAFLASGGARMKLHLFRQDLQDYQDFFGLVYLSCPSCQKMYCLCRQVFYSIKLAAFQASGAARMKLHVAGTANRRTAEYRMSKDGIAALCLL